MADQAICPLHSVLEEQIMMLSEQLHDTKISIIRILIAACSAITGIVTAGVWC